MSFSCIKHHCRVRIADIIQRKSTVAIWIYSRVIMLAYLEITLKLDKGTPTIRANNMESRHIHHSVTLVR